MTERPAIDYLIARSGPPPPSGRAYDYVLGGDGLYLAARDELFDLRLPVALARVRGLPPLQAACALRHGKLPNTAWHDLVDSARTWALAGHEVVLTVVWELPWGYRTVRPPRVVAAESDEGRPIAGAVLEVRSHPRPAEPGPGDHTSGRGPLIYATLSDLTGPRPEVALAVGAFGHSMPLAWESVFEGPRGAFAAARPAG